MLTAMRILFGLCISITCSLMAVPSQGQTIMLQCRRSLDHAGFAPDSMRVVSEHWGIDTLVRGSVLALSAPTSVYEAESSSPAMVDVYDLQGRYIRSQIISPVRDGVFWDADLGIIIIRRIGTANGYAHASQRAFSLLQDVHTFEITVWRRGYVTSRSVHTIAEFSDPVQIVLELLPWWQRVRAFTMDVFTPFNRYVQISEYSDKQGGGSSIDTGYTPFTYHTSFNSSLIGHYYYQPIINETTFAYEFPVAPAYAPEYYAQGVLTVDPTSGMIEKLVSRNSHGADAGSKVDWWFVEVSNLPMGVQTADTYRIHLSGDSALKHIDSTRYDNWEIYYYGNYSTEYNTHREGITPGQSGLLFDLEFVLWD